MKHLLIIDHVADLANVVKNGLTFAYNVNNSEMITAVKSLSGYCGGALIEKAGTMYKIMYKD